MAQPINYAEQLGLLSNIANAPTFLDREIQRSLGQAQVEQIRANTALLNQQVQQGLVATRQQEEYSREVQEALESGDMRRVSDLIARFPQFKDALKTSWDQKDAFDKRHELRQAAGIWSALNAGNTDAAIKQLESRIAADRRAKLPTDDDEERLNMLRSGNPADLNTVKGQLGMFMASVVPDRFAAVIEQLGTGRDEKDWKVVGPTVGYGDAEGNWHTAYTAPDRFTISGEGGTRFETPGATAVNSGSLSVEAVAPHIVAQESGGNYAARNSETGAMGAYQVMPATGRALAEKLGMAWNPGLMTSASASGRAYQDRIGQAAVQEAIDASGGDPRVMASYYHGGSDRGKWGTRTQQYASEVAARIMGGAPQGAVATASVPKAAKEKTRILSPQEVAGVPGLDPNMVYQQTAEGTISPVGGQKQGQLRPLPPPVLQARASNIAALRNIDGALALLNPKNKSAAARSAQNAIGPGTGMLGDTFTQWNDPKGADFRAQIGQIGGIIIKDTSGAAVSLSEDQRLAKWVPMVTDTPSAVISKLKNLKREIMQRNQALADTFSEDQGYRPINSAGAAPVRVHSIQEALKLKPGTIFIDPYNRRKVR